LDYQFEFTPTTDDISDIFGFDRCTFKILARKDDSYDTYFDPATEINSFDDIKDKSRITDAGNFYMNFKGFLFQGEYYDGNNAYGHLPEEMLVTGLPVVSFDHHNNIA
jgi:hypothetical protein